MLDGHAVSVEGSRVDRPEASKTYRLTLVLPDANEVVAVSADVSVILGRTVTISNNRQQDLFQQAIATPGTVVRIQDHVDLDLSDRVSLPIADGVRILGGRTSSNPGPRIFTRTSPKVFLQTRETKNVRISGIRLYGGEMDVVDRETEGSTALAIYSSVNVEIDNNEIYGWQGSGVAVRDPSKVLNMENAGAVRVHDNYIHHNRHKRREGYGVVTYDGAYTLIESNVFDFNRHAIASDGESGTGYLAYRNLVLMGGGENTWATNTHMFDVHGTESCGGKSQYCGPAGEYFDYSYNTVMYTGGTSIKVRGVPSVRADARWNVFALSREWEGLPLYESGAFHQTQGHNLLPLNNKFGEWPNISAQCDFDADGKQDRFMTTGTTWWFQGTQGWSFLNTNNKRLDELELSDLNNDGRCDVRSKSDGVVFNGGRAAPAARVDISWKSTGTALSRVWQLRNGKVQRDFVSDNYSFGWDLAGTGDFNADGVIDNIWRGPAGQVAIRLTTHLGEIVPDIGTLQDLRGTLPSTTVLATTGDLDGDRRADLVWRHQDGRLEFWPAGRADNAAPISPGNDSAASVGGGWRVKAAGDFDRDGRADLLWSNDDGRLSIWYMDGHFVSKSYDLPPPQTQDPFKWTFQGLGDFDADGRSDILLRRPDNGGLKIIRFNSTYPSAVYPAYQNKPSAQTSVGWTIKGVADFNFDGRSDIIWQHTDGGVGIWMMDGDRHIGETYPTSPDVPKGNSFRIAAIRPVFQYAPGVVLPDVPPNSVTVPNVRQLTVTQARAPLTAADLTIGTVKSVPDPTCNNIGRITTQSPAAYSTAPRGSTVNLSVGSKPATPCP
ncbi:FG-GAP-like repeat-containing protein [Kribbella sp. NBC_01505]|uniref:FG-GAP-like repeat-containing protein n=1 Tax=Kribbella sp. NBC_01505 TaxID=2903580 RepID=UPI003870D58B